VGSKTQILAVNHQRRRVTMSNRRQFVPQTATVLLACGLIIGLLPGFAGAQDGSEKLPSTRKGLPEMPMTARPENSLAYEVSQKPAIASKKLSDMESLENWEPWVDPRAYGTISLSDDRYYKGQASVLLTSPTKGEKPNFASTRGRPWGCSSAIYRAESEDWTEWNRITLWVYPDLPGFRTVSFNLVLHNDNPIDPTVDNKQYDDAFVPYDSANGYYYYNLYSGLNYQLLENHKWNKVYWEIPHVRRDKVIALELRYRLQGNQREMTDTVKYYFDELYLEKVEQPEHYEGWNVAPGQIAHNHIGYRTGCPKTALSADPSAKTFTLIDVDTKQVALKKPTTLMKTRQGTFQVLDFSEVDRPGTYALKAGDVQTRPFRIGDFDDLYRGTLIKLINFFYCQRCGTEIPGRHSACHGDFICSHGDKSIVINGGWHDAGDLSQSTQHTSGAVHALLSLAEMLQDTDAELSERLLEEAKWGLDWVLKTRFGDGYRVNWGVMDFWTDGIIGTVDDVTATPSNTQSRLHAYATVNLHAARAEAKASILLSERDPIMANHALRCAEQDWNFAVERIQDLDMVIAGIGLNASLALYEATQDEKYRSAAISYGDYILRCQQRDDLSDRVPLKGFFFGNAGRERIPLPRSISSPEKYAVTGLVGLLQAFPKGEHVEEWRSAIRLYADYHKAMAAYTNPYFMLPAGICDVNVAEDEIEEAKIRNGIQLDDRFYIKCFPVWTTGRGNTSVILSKAIGLAAIARYLKDQKLLTLAYRQFDWLLGLNPFNQSIMWGEGYRYQALYTPLSGNIVGAVPCGIHTKFNRDVPYWPSDNWHNPKEIWVHSSSDWLWLMSNVFN
jgi:hypothetical protein